MGPHRGLRRSYETRRDEIDEDLLVATPVYYYYYYYFLFCTLFHYATSPPLVSGLFSSWATLNRLVMACMHGGDLG